MKDLDTITRRKELVKSDIYKEIRTEQLEMIIDMARNGQEPLEIIGMLRLIGKTDDWEKKFEKAKKGE